MVVNINCININVDGMIRVGGYKVFFIINVVYLYIGKGGINLFN